MEEDCIFCKITEGKILATKLFESEKVLCFMDVFPASTGHCLVIPKKHHETILNVPQEELCEIIKTVQKTAAAIEKATKCDGFNVFQSNHEIAGQAIKHVHFHIIPRYKNDRLNFKWEPNKIELKELEEWQKKIKNHF